MIATFCFIVAFLVSLIFIYEWKHDKDFPWLLILGTLSVANLLIGIFLLWA